MITLVTGATGTVGAAVTDELLAAGRRVRALVRDVDRARKLLPAAVELVPGDITDAASVAAAVKGCGAVFHTAGLPEQWLKDPSRFVAVNVEGSKHVGEAALAAGVASFVYTSTIDVFAWQHDTAFDETQLATSPKGSHYERSKQEADRAMVALQERGLPVRYTHPSAVYGPAPVVNPGLNDVLVRLVRGKLPMLLPGGIPVVRTERGGQVTYHGPGQVVAYVLLDLRRSGLGIRELVRALEQAVIDLVAEDGVRAVRHDGAPGVYVAMHNQVLQFPGVVKDKERGTFTRANG